MKLLLTFRVVWLAVVWCMAAALPAQGDTIVLKSGEKLDGKVISETPTEVTVSVKVTASITDERVIPRGEISKIEKEAADSQAYQALRNTKPGANSLPAASYAPIIRNLQAFVDQHPKSTHAAEIGQLLAAFADEKRRVDAGEVKVQNRWLSKEEASRERYQINAQIILNFLQEQARRGDLVGALNSFDQLEKSYPGARSYIDGVETAKQIIAALLQNAARAQATLQARMKERELTLSQAGEAERAGLEATIAQEDQQVDAAFEGANRGGLAWPPMIAQSAKSLEAVTTKAREEQQRLNALPLADMRSSLESAQKAKGFLSSNELEKAEKEIEQAISKWSANEIATRVQTEVVAARAAASGGEAAAEEPAPESMEEKPLETTEGAVTPESSEGGTTPESSETVVQDAPVEESRSKLPMIVIGIIVIILLLLARYAMKKISSKANEIIE